MGSNMGYPQPRSPISACLFKAKAIPWCEKPYRQVTGYGAKHLTVTCGSRRTVLSKYQFIAHLFPYTSGEMSYI